MHLCLTAFVLIVLCGQHSAYGMKRERAQRDQSHDEQKKERIVHTTRYGKAVQALPEVPSLFDAQSLEELEAALKQGSSVEERNKHGETPLHYFVYKNRTDAVRLLLMHGAACGAMDNNSCTPYHTAVHEGAEMVYCLMKNPQGGPQWYTEEFRTWQQSIEVSSMIFRRYGVCKDVRLIIVKKLMPPIELMHSMVPLRHLPYFMQFYQPEQREIVADRLVKRHIADTRFALLAKNIHNETPQQLAVHRQNRLATIAAPIGPLDPNTLTNNIKDIHGAYCTLLSVPNAQVPEDAPEVL